MGTAATGRAKRKTRARDERLAGTGNGGDNVTFTCGCGRTVDTVNGYTVTVYVRPDTANRFAPSGRIERDMCRGCFNRATLIARASGGTVRTRPIGVVARHRTVTADRRTGKPAVSIVQRVPAVVRGGIVERDDLPERPTVHDNGAPSVPVCGGSTGRWRGTSDGRVVWVRNGFNGAGTIV